MCGDELFDRWCMDDGPDGGKILIHDSTSMGMVGAWLLCTYELGVLTSWCLRPTRYDTNTSLRAARVDHYSVLFESELQCVMGRQMGQICYRGVLSCHARLARTHRLS